MKYNIPQYNIHYYYYLLIAIYVFIDAVIDTISNLIVEDLEAYTSGEEDPIGTYHVKFSNLPEADK